MSSTAPSTACAGENDINIAFNQLEVHLRNEKGDEVTEVKRDGKGDDLAPTTAS